LAHETNRDSGVIMTKLVHRLAAVLFLLAGCSTVGLAADLNVVHSGKWPPYADADLPGQGLAVEIVTTALKRAGYTTYMRIDSLDRILEGGALGVYDVFATPWYSDARNHYLEFSEPYLESRIRFIKRKDKTLDYHSLDDMKGVMVGTVKDYAYGEAFDQARDIIKIPERNLIQNLLKLTQGRIDATLDDELVLQYEINRYMPNSMKELEFLDPPLAVRGIHIGVSRENPDHAKIVAAFNKAISEMKKDGSFDAIVSKHHIYITKPAY
jgi:polar amino acid transport system substrate-binding protein